MAWSTSVVAPPDGAMADYMASLDKLRGRGEAIYWPGHGGPVRDPQRYVRALISHRRQREAAILARLAAGDRYRGAVALVAVADVAGYDYWPVRGFVKDAIRKESVKQGTSIYCDWDGHVRRGLELDAGTSNVVLYGKDGSVIFADKGALSAARRGALLDLLRRQVEG